MTTVAYRGKKIVRDAETKWQDTEGGQYEASNADGTLGSIK